MGVRLVEVAQLVPWALLVVWWFVLLGFRRRRAWLRSTPVAVGLVLTTLAADVSAVLATGRMSATHGQSLAMGLLWIACLLSITTFLVLRGPRDDGDDGGGEPPDEPPEPPWWPEFERQFRDYARRAPRRPATRPPRAPAGRS